jgi:hypothetical protein
MRVAASARRPDYLGSLADRADPVRDGGIAMSTGPARRTSDWPHDADVETAAAWATAVHRARGPRARLAAAAGSAAARAGLAAAVRVWRSLPVVDLPIGPGAHGTEVASAFGGPVRFSPQDRGPVAVLQVPGTLAEHLAGRPRQALRTNVSRARTAGISYRTVTADDERRAAVRAVAGLRHQDPGAMIRDRGDGDAPSRMLVATTADGESVGLAEVVVDGTSAALTTLVTAPDSPAGPALRYLLHLAVVEDLVGEGVELLVVSGSMLLTPAGTRYFQRRTGFVPARVRLVRDQSSSGRSVSSDAARPGWSGTPGSASGTQATPVLSEFSRRSAGSSAPAGTASTVV